MKANPSQASVGYTTHNDGKLIVPITLGVVAIMVGIVAFVAIQTAIAWAFYAIDPVWGMIAYKACWMIGLFWTSAKLLKRAYR